MQTIIEAGRTEKHYWRDLWHYRELFYVLATRDVAVRYKQTVIGIAWAVIRPLLTMFIFSILFGRLAGLPSDGKTPYQLMVLAGILPWTFFSQAFGTASTSLVSAARMIGKIYFPRIIVPTATLVVSVIDLIISFGVLAVAMVWFHFVPSWHLVFLPAFVLVIFMVTLGPSLWVSAINVKYRDFRYIVTFIVQFGLYVSPVGFSSHVVPAKWRLLYSVNPLVGAIDGFRWCLLGGNSTIYWPGFALSIGIVVVLLWLGVRQFRKMEKTFADLI